MFSDLNSDGYANNAYQKTFLGSETGLDYNISFRALSFGGKLTWNPNDGGVGIGDEEITGGREVLLLGFSKPVYISTFELVDLFHEGPNDSRYAERDYSAYDSGFANGLSIDGFRGFEAYLGQTIGGEGPEAGQYSIGIDGEVQGIAFFAEFNSRSDFAVAGFTTPVPEPSSVLLLGLGLIGLAGLGRMKLKHK